MLAILVWDHPITAVSSLQAHSLPPNTHTHHPSGDDKIYLTLIIITIFINIIIHHYWHPDDQPTARGLEREQMAATTKKKNKRCLKSWCSHNGKYVHLKSWTKINSAVKRSVMTPSAIYISTNSRHSYHEAEPWCIKIAKLAAWGRKSRNSRRRDSARLREMLNYKDDDTSQVVKQKQRPTGTQKDKHRETDTLSLSVSVSRSHCPTPESPSWQATVLPLPKKPWDLSIVHDQPDWPPELNNLQLQSHIHTSLLLCCHIKRRQAAKQITAKDDALCHAIFHPSKLTLRQTWMQCMQDMKHRVLMWNMTNRWTDESCDQVSRPYVGGQTAGPVVFRRPAISMCFGLTHGQWGHSHFSCSWYELRKIMMCLSLNICQV